MALFLMKNFIRRMYTTEILMLNDAATDNVFLILQRVLWSRMKKKTCKNAVPQPLESQMDL